MRFELAGHSDDGELRRLLRDNPMPGGFSLAFEREPSFFHAAALEGDKHETIVARDPVNGRAVGLLSRSVRRAWVNGESVRLGYLSQIRVDSAYRGKGLLEAGSSKLEELHHNDQVPLYITTIIEANKLARAILERDRRWKPVYRRWSKLSTLAIFLGRHRRGARACGGEVRPASPADLPEIVACLQRNYRKYQFAPEWSAEDLLHSERTRDLDVCDFWIATRRGRVTGCLALWDQQGFKQNVVRGYRGAFRLLRPVYNPVAPLLSMPRLPAVGQAVPHVYVSHVAVDDHDGDTLQALVGAAYDASLGRGLAYLTVAFCQDNPLLPLVKRGFRHLEYPSILYVVFWPDGRRQYEKLDRRLSHVELAVI